MKFVTNLKDPPHLKCRCHKISTPTHPPWRDVIYGWPLIQVCMTQFFAAKEQSTSFIVLEYHNFLANVSAVQWAVYYVTIIVRIFSIVKKPTLFCIPLIKLLFSRTPHLSGTDFFCPLDLISELKSWNSHDSSGILH